MSGYTRDTLLAEMSNWSTDEVVTLLQKNDFSECCDAVIKRQVDGEGLLRLSERNLNLWGRDLSRSLREKLCRFVEDLNNHPDRYCIAEIGPISPSAGDSEILTDEDPWDTEFEDDCSSKGTDEDLSENENFNDSSKMHRNGNPGHHFRAPPGVPVNGPSRLQNNVQEDDNIYANGTATNESKTQTRVNANKKNGESIVEAFKKELERHESKNKPAVNPKPESLKNNSELSEFIRKKQAQLSSQNSFSLKTNSNNTTPSVGVGKNIGAQLVKNPPKLPLPPKPKIISQIAPVPDEKPRVLPKPPLSPLRIKHLDLVADLPLENHDDSDEYDYEPIKGQATEQRYRSSESVKSGNSSQFLGNCRSAKSSSENVNHPSSNSSIEDNQDVYESIPERLGDRDSYVPPICSRQFVSLPRTLPARPLNTSSLPKRPETKKFATVPTVASQSSATRPLPPPPHIGPRTVRQLDPPIRNFENISSYTEQPWYHNIGRTEAIALIEGGPNPPPDGYFLLRPSSAKANQPWTLVLWYKDKTYNIAVRKRPDLKYALGKVKPGELSFASIEELINYYKNEELVLNGSNGDSPAGSTRLTETPTKSRNL